MGRYRSYSSEFKRQVALEYLGGETFHGLSRRYGMSRTLIKIWVAKQEAGEFDDEQVSADLVAEYEARVAELERKVGQLTMENDLLKKTARMPRQSSDVPSVVSGPKASRSGGDAS